MAGPYAKPMHITAHARTTLTWFPAGSKEKEASTNSKKKNATERDEQGYYFLEISPRQGDLEERH